MVSLGLEWGQWDVGGVMGGVVGTLDGIIG